MPLPAFCEPLSDGLWAIDTGFHRDRFDAAYLVAEGGRAAFIDTGTAFAVPRLLAALDVLGLPRAAVDYVIATHVHLDHAGGVGPLMQALPGARLVVHPRGARHMIDPTALWQGALGVYGEAQMARAYGTLVPVDADRVHPTADGETLHLAGPPARLRPHAGACAAPPLHLGRAQRRLVHRRQLRDGLSRVRGRRPRLHLPDHHAGAVRARRDARVDRAPDGHRAAPDVPHALQPHHRRARLRRTAART